ncbi:hypothetical protein HYW83_02720 [Candidatus Peregrinibacteria bacterium]|nr:hypothetical protein [Candidatus Peregrinibacteria bacterium]
MGEGEAPKLEQQPAPAPPPQEAGVEAGTEAHAREPEVTLLQLGDNGSYEAAANRQPEETRARGKEYVVATVAGANARIDAISKSPGLNLPADRLTQAPAADAMGDISHEAEHNEEKWKKVGVAAQDSNGNVYVTQVNERQEVLYVPIGGPKAELVYSRSGNVIGFTGADNAIHLHAPKNGWGNLDVSPVGVIANEFEGTGSIPDFSKYKIPETKVTLGGTPRGVISGGEASAGL